MPALLWEAGHGAADERRHPPALTADVALAEIEACLGRPLGSVFRRLNGSGVPALLGQVHQATLLDGRAVVVKVQNPAAEKLVLREFRALSDVVARMGHWRPGFNRSAYRHELADVLTQAIDYRHEAQTLLAFRLLTDGWPDVEIPSVVAGLSNRRLLVTSRIGGSAVTAVDGWPEAKRRRIGRVLLRLFVSGCLNWGVVHGEHGSATYRFSEGDDGCPRLGIHGFESVKRMSPALVQNLNALVRVARTAGKHADADELLSRYIAMGFDPELLEPLKAALPALTQVLLEPLVSREPFALETWRPGERCAAILGRFLRNFELAMPIQISFLWRSCHNLLALLRALGVPAEWGSVAEEAREPSPAASPPPATLSGAERSPAPARWLRVFILESGRAEIDLTFRTAMLPILANIVPAELKSKLQRRGIDIAQAARSAATAGPVPGDLVHVQEQGAEIHVWIE